MRGRKGRPTLSSFSTEVFAKFLSCKGARLRRMEFLAFSVCQGKKETGGYDLTRRRDPSKRSRSSVEIPEEPNARNEGRPEAKAL